MQKLRTLIEQHLEDFPHYDYYFQHMDQANDMREDYPDIAIELCYALYQGVSKTIILNLAKDPVLKTFKDRRNNAHISTSKLFANAQQCLKDSGASDENIFEPLTKNLCNLVSELRNDRGDISHGKPAPKEVYSDVLLATTIMELTNTLLFYTLSSYYQILRQEEATKIKYENNPDFNIYLDDLHPAQDKVIHSEALFALYPEDYRIQLEAFREKQELPEE